VNPDKRKGALPGAPSHTTNYSRTETVAGPRTEKERLELKALIAEQAQECEFGARAFRASPRIPGVPSNPVRPRDFRYPDPPWQERLTHDVHSAAFHRCEREGQGWQLDLDAIHNRLDREGELMSEPEPDYWRAPESISTRLADPERIRQALSYVPLSPSLLHGALNNKRWRTPEQVDMLNRLTTFMRKWDVCLTALAAVIDCNRKTLERMRGKMTVMEKLEQLERQLERIERATQELVDERGLNPVKEAERILADFEDELAA